MSPGAALRFPPLAILGLHHGGPQIDAPARRAPPPHVHADRIAEPHRLPGPLADERGALLVEVPPLAAQRPRGQEALEALVAEAHERAAAHEPDDLTVEGPVPAVLVQAAVEQERHAYVFGVALDLHLLALGRRRVLARLGQVGRAWR